MYFARIPLKTSPRIVHGNALTLDWNEVLPAERASYVLGNPPFVGKSLQDAKQKADMVLVMQGINGAGILDFVSAWYIKAARYIAGIHFPPPQEAPFQPPPLQGEGWGGDGVRAEQSLIRCAFVSTNSITQGEQVGVLWGWLLAQGIHIHFAHRTFQWSNEAKGVAAVHCAIIGFGLQDAEKKVIYEYEDIRGEPHAIIAGNISPYLVDAPNITLANRRAPICTVPLMNFGSMPNDGGNLLLSDEDKKHLLEVEPKAEAWIKPFLGADEFINGLQRWCLWLVGIPASELRAMPEVYKRVQAVRTLRLDSSRKETQELANTPYLFGENRQPLSPYLLVPSVSSERREFVPIGFLQPEVIASNLVLTISDATPYHFAILNSTMHNAWMRAVCGRLESRYRYSASVVYNNYLWPEPTDKQRTTIEATGKAILDARVLQPESTLADLYDPLTMPAELRKAHTANDRAVDAAYGYKGDKSDAARVAFLFDLYGKLISLLPADKSRRRTKE
jgi:hypothetical protein